MLLATLFHIYPASTKRDMTIVSINKIANGGDGIGQLPDGRVVFIPRALPGDTVEIAVTQSKKRWARGRVVRVVEPSPDRVAPGCSHFDVCGGCAFQHVTYEAELRAKAAAARDAFARISGIADAVGEDVAADDSAGYRIRTRWHAKRGVLGYFRSGSHEPFALRECPVLHPRLVEVARALAPLLTSETATIAAEINGEQIVVAGAVSPEVAAKIAALDHVAGVVADDQAIGEVSINSRDAWGIDVSATLGAGRFRQSNGPMTATLRDRVLSHLAVSGGGQLIEYFAGSGSFTHHAANHFEAVTAYELDAVAVATGNEVATELGAATQFLVANLEQDAPPPSAGATVLLDPPRTGAAALCAMLAASAASRIVYVACDIGTLARDAKTLAEAAFTLRRLDLIDMFPRTAHIEAIAVFDRRRDHV